MTVAVRKAVAKDLGEMAELLADLFSIEKDFAPDRERQERGLSLMLSESGKAVFVAEASGKVAGMVTGQLMLSTAEGGLSLLIEDLVVAAGFRGEGIGSRLLASVELWGREKGATRLQLVADRDNTPARVFYERSGWRTTNLCVLTKSNETVTLCPGVKPAGGQENNNA